jgi:hypothetical protein
MELFTFIELFLILILIGTLTVTGWFFITRGRKEMLPDGTLISKGKIFKGWFFFWTRTKGKEVVFYKGDQIVQLYRLYQIEYPGNPYNLHSGGNSFIVGIRDRDRYLSLLKNDLPQIEERLGCKIDLKQEVLSLYKLYDRYVFPWWVRDPLAVCSTCFASIYGSIFYWSVILLANDLFAWTEHIFFAKIFFWVAFCLSLAVCNTALAKKFN